MKKLDTGHPTILFKHGDKVIQLSDPSIILTIDGDPHWEEGDLYLRYSFKENTMQVFEQYLRKLINQK